MRRNWNCVALSIAASLYALINPAVAGSPETEAGRCTRWLNAFISHNIDQASEIPVEQLKPNDVPSTYVDSQRKLMSTVYDNIVKIGGSEPKLSKALDDHVVAGTNDIIKSQVWSFHNASAYVGCVSYPGTDSPWHLVVKFDDNIDSLLKSLENAARSRVSSPPARQ